MHYMQARPRYTVAHILVYSDLVYEPISLANIFGAELEDYNAI